VTISSQFCFLIFARKLPVERLGTVGRGEGRCMGIERQVVSHWFAERQEPTDQQVLALLEFMKAP
jgi:hypothetical protein